MSPLQLRWIDIVRLGLVQASIGGVVGLTTSTLNRVMVVEMSLPHIIPAVLVGLHYGMQMARPRWGYGSDVGHRRTPWIMGGMGALCLGAVLATDGVILSGHDAVAGFALSVVAYLLIGGGAGACGTSLLALLATGTAPARRPAAASLTWIMMILGIVISTIVVSVLIDPFTEQALAIAVGVVCAGAFVVTLLAIHGIEARLPVQGPADRLGAGPHEPKPTFRAALARVWAEPLGRQFAIFIFVSMLAYNAQDIVLEPFAGLVFGYTPAESTRLATHQSTGVLLGMILCGILAGRSARRQAALRDWMVAGCVGSALGLAGLSAGALVGPGWPLGVNAFLSGVALGVFSVAAIGSMMGLAGVGREGHEGTRMGLWGAAQGTAFGLGGMLSGGSSDVGRALLRDDGMAFMLVFGGIAILFLVAAFVALGLPSEVRDRNALASDDARLAVPS
jgi:BCD family chlorophyll transporter-like MFS transporter